MDDKKEKPFFEISGVFYSSCDPPIVGYASTHGLHWEVSTEEGEGFIRDSLYLDRERKIIAPKNQHQKNWAIEQIEDLINKYQEKVKELSQLSKIKTFAMKLLMAQTFLLEYRSLKYSYFSSNAIKFILFDNF